MSAIERDDEPMIDDEPIDEPEPEPLPPPVKAAKADGRKKPRSAKQEAAFKAMTEKRKMLIAQKKAGHTPTRTTPAAAPTPAAQGTVNNYYYYSHEMGQPVDTPPPKAPKLQRSKPAPEPEYEDTSSDDDDYAEIPTARQTIYFG